MIEVEKLLNDKGIPFQDKGKDLLVSCLNPEHDDSNPSLRIDKNEGHFHCLSCGYKGNIFSLYNRYRNIFNSKIRKTLRTISDLKLASWTGYSIPDNAVFVETPFRGIPAHIIKKFEAFTSNSNGMEDRIVFPIRNTTENIVGFQGRHELKAASPKYLMYPKEVSLPWFPTINKIELRNNSMILVEGLLDALYLHGKGITNAVAIFGTKSVSYDNILEYLTPYILGGLETVHLLMDGDSAGRSAAKHIESCIKQKTDLIVNIIEIEEGLDPATLSDEYIKNLRYNTYQSV